MKAWTIAIASMMLTASALSIAAGINALSDGAKTATPPLLLASVALILLGLTLAVAAKYRNSRPRHERGD
ncbi:hypothetical protein [Paenarthrobacter sp. YJN-5]|uniref:hypothetical protein n=1 Tax=Paenarthrobacter sp. YJN-5 TaxID=2735316 RepID=UPI0018785119|nr:hypothetical protein [Paenarthrobacter sp. YJN-5]QOT19589.1 hypothetical protein HMI59_23490 [Paenarthrobacter sp. YJN-5]